jgi:integrase
MSDKHVTVWVQRFKDRPHLVLQWINPDTGRRKSKSAKTADPKEAKQAAADLEYELRHGRYSETGEIAWEDFRARFDEEYVALRRLGSQERYHRALDRFEELCRPGKLRSITARTLTAYVAELRKLPGKKRGSTQSPVTVAYALTVLRIALRWGVRQGYLVQLPPFPAVRAPKKSPPVIPAETVERLLAVAQDDPPMYAFLLCGWLAGLRLGEALALEWGPADVAPWIDFARERLWLPAEFVKANRDQWVPLDPQLHRALAVLPRHGRKVFRFAKADNTPLKRSGLIARITALAHKAGVRLSMKALRKAFGSHYAARVPAQVLQKLMRHSNISTTMQFYANVDAAVEEAILGPRRNTLCNTEQPAESLPAPTAANNPLQDKELQT